MRETGVYTPWEARYPEVKERFEKEHAVAMAVLDIGGVHPDKQAPMLNPYLEIGELDAENFGNIGEHCVAVGCCAEQIADALIAAGAIDAAEKGAIVGRAIIHDANKRFEVYRRKAQKAGAPVEVYSRSAYDTMYDVLQDKDMTGPLVEYVRHAGKETGHTSLSQFVQLQEDGGSALRQDLTLHEMIVHLADDMVASPLPGQTQNTDTRLVTIDERMMLGNFSERYPFLFVEGFGFRDDGTVSEVKDAVANQDGTIREGRTYADWQQRVARWICEKLQQSIDPESSIDPELFIKQLVNKH